MGVFESRILDIIEELLGARSIRQKTFDWLLNTHMSVENLQAMKILEHTFTALLCNKEQG